MRGGFKRKPSYAAVLIVFISASLIVSAADQGLVSNEQNQALTMEEAVAQSLLSNRSLQEAKADLELAEIDSDLVDKTIVLNGRVEQAWIESGGATDQTLTTSGSVILNEKWSVSTTFGTYISAFGVRYNPFTLEGVQRRISQKLMLMEKVAVYERTKADVIVGVKKAFYEALQKEKLMKLAEENLRLSKEYLKMTETLFNSGKLSKLDLLEAEQQVKVAKTRLVSVELNNEIARSKLETVIGAKLRGRTLWFNSTDSSIVEKIELETALNQAREASPERRVKTVAVELAELNGEIASSYRLKDLAFGTGYNKNDQEMTTTYALFMEGPLFVESGKGQIEVAEKAIAQSRLALEVYDENLQTSAQEALGYLKLTELGLVPSKDLIELAKERLEIVTLRYRHGAAAGYEVIQAQQYLGTAQEQYWEVWLNWRLARTDFDRLLWREPLLK